jgi:hypothetical protein
MNIGSLSVWACGAADGTEGLAFVRSISLTAIDSLRFVIYIHIYRYRYTYTYVCNITSRLLLYSDITFIHDK